MTRAILHAATAVAMLAVPSAVTAQSNDNLYGTRKLDVSKSTYSPGPAPSGGSLTVTMKPVKDGFMMIADVVTPAGQSQHNEVFATFDGKDHPMGNTGNATIAFRKLDDNTYERIDKVDGKVTTTSKITVSDGGNTHTMDQTGTNRSGQPMHNILVFTK